jgi:hypothetical protein
MLVIKITEEGNIPQGSCAEPWGIFGVSIQYLKTGVKIKMKN